MKKKFNFKNYKTCAYVMNCKTELEAKNFCAFMAANGKVWSNGENYCSNNNWGTYKANTCYNFNTNFYASIEFYIEEGYTILNYSDFDWSDNNFTKSDLRTGDFVVLRNGDVACVLLKYNLLLEKNSWYDLGEYNDNLEDFHSFVNFSDYDIMKVYRPSESCQACFNNFNMGKLLYDRKEIEKVEAEETIEEMTISQICESLGKKIKIIVE